MSLWFDGTRYAVIRRGEVLATFNAPPRGSGYGNSPEVATDQATASPATTTKPRVQTPAYPPAASTWQPPLVAENGSYYGQISERTGLPRTTYVNGYYRRDGTYVRGYYRSR